MKAWLRFAGVQLISLVATVVGWFLLIPFCLAQAWTVNGEIDRWSWKPLNLIYGNPEDGVSGQKALIWNKEGTARVPYMPTAWAPLRAYLWSAWRNSSDNLKYVFAWKGGPFKKFYLQFGWNTSGLPVISFGSM